MASAVKKSPKKRKHATFQDEDSSQGTTPIRVEVAPSNPSKDPIVVSFPRGLPASILQHDHQTHKNDDTTEDLPRFTWSRPNPNSDRGRIVTGSDDTCVYSATAAGRGYDGRLTKVYVAILDKRAKTLKLVPAAEKGTIFALNQTVKAYTPNVVGGAMAVGGLNGQNQASASGRVQMLVESFGSKKKQKVMASRAANIVNINKVVGAGNAMMDSVVGQGGMISTENREMLMDGSKVVDGVEAALHQARKNFLPPFDEKASTPDRVYNPQDMAGANAWSQVARIVDKVLKKAKEEGTKEWIEPIFGGGRANAVIPQSIKELLENLDPFNKTGHVFRVKTIFFLFLTMRFYSKISQRKRILGDAEDDCVIQTRAPPQVGARFLELFMSPIVGKKEHGFFISVAQLDKLLAYIFILYVVASGSDMKVSSINQLCKDIKIDHQKAVQIYRGAGFTVKNAAGAVGVHLSVPLTFPPPKKGGKR
ncbi:hypothetical protein HJC23_009867 [Cyclotella cryptica]|uniref:Uncharacterized protein n=1 Tax=Cyclotella cryptica TaxID=29204 RepID=A0ABD3QBK1_9STRA|eukprot:CCRYP_006980-RA/>CCRYP_006980-RA protein AED:0.02 eAED:0.02 QI:28/1/1/1/1/1/2/117/477